ncbi:sensor histidine kinase [Streptomyces sp. 150FB]|uniref:sensor histidine kinase n=1 Tax=Streptomyces sp. 150FB TaxID=1576605 RepID=UPI0007C7FE5F|nr:sensor histidine kinase [Streptomyces sp. 150FB]
MRTQTQGGPLPAPANYGPETGGRWFGLWDTYFTISYLVTVAFLLGFDGGLDAGGGAVAVAIGAMTLMVIWYAALGRALMIDAGERRSSRGAVVFVGGLLVLFVVADAFDLRSSFSLFAVVPMLIMSLPIRPALALSMVANLWPVAAVLFQGGDLDSAVRGVLPMSLLGLALSVLLGLWITRVVGQSKDRGELIAELRRTRESVARLSHEAGISAERERLAREIHDTLAQSLTSVIGLVQAAESEVEPSPDLALRHLGLAGRVARESLAETRDFVAALTPPSLRESSLAQALRRQAETLTAETGLDVRCSVEGVEEPLPVAVSVVLLRSAQEAIANVRKHATRARVVEVVVAFEGKTDRDEDVVRLTIRDDGEGFTPFDEQDAVSGQQGGFGLPGMRARAEEINGTAVVRSVPGEGTTVEVTVPLGAGAGAGVVGVGAEPVDSVDSRGGR